MNPEAIKEKFQNLNIWKKGDERAPHKPLLVLYALGQWQQGRRELSFPEIETDLKELLMEFGPPRESYHPEYPFWFLQSDGIWQLDNVEGIKIRTGGLNAPIGELRSRNATGYFAPEVARFFEANPNVVYELANELLFAHFPISLHGDIREAVGLMYPLMRSQPSQIMEIDFEKQVLAAYEERCAVCGFGVWIGGRVVGVEATHIKWPQAGGLDTMDNAIALCSLHRNLFDRGAYTINNTYSISVSPLLEGVDNSAYLLTSFERKTIKLPSQHHSFPNTNLLKWHYGEVFKHGEH